MDASRSDWSISTGVISDMFSAIPAAAFAASASSVESQTLNEKISFPLTAIEYARKPG